jgi:Anti-repressor SinI
LSNNVKELDTEWVELVLYALELGITRDEISDFFKKYAKLT